MIFCQETQSSGNNASSKMAVRLPSLDILCGPWKMIEKSSTFTFSSCIQDDQAKSEQGGRFSLMMRRGRRIYQVTYNAIP